MRALLNRIANPVVRGLLRSPFHGLLSRSVMLITVTGRRTGRRYTLPVQYVRHGDTVYVFSPGDRPWWRNLSGGGSVALRIGNQPLTGMGEVLRGSAADDARVTLKGTPLERSVRRSLNGVIVRLRLIPSDRG